MEYNFDFYPDCVKGILPIKERAKILKDFIQQQDEEYILALYDKMHGRVTDLRIEQNITQNLKIAIDCNKETITELKEKLKQALSQIHNFK